MSATLELALDPEKLYEIVDGQPEEKAMPGARHGGIGARLLIELGLFLRTQPIGSCYAETSFTVGSNERIPDVSFVAAERIPAEGEPVGAWPFAPDLAVEIISPSDLHDKVSRKVLEYLEAGVRQVWLVSAESQSVTIFRSPTDVKVFAGDDALEADDLFPGFRLALRDLFQPRVPRPNQP